MTDNIFDRSLYARAPALDVQSGLSLSRALETASPPQPTADVSRCLVQMGRCAGALERKWLDYTLATKPVDRRPFDVAEDGSVGSLESRLLTYASLPVDRYPKAAVAARIHRILFSEGLGFLRFPYVQQWAVTEKLLKLIAEQNLQADIDLVCGPEFLMEVRRTHDEYGRALGITEKQPVLDVPTWAEELRQLQMAIADYLWVVAGMDHNDPATLAVMRAALKPVDDFREGQMERAANSQSSTPQPDKSGEKG